MTSKSLLIALGLALALLSLPSAALTHITPPVVLISDRDAVVSMTAGAKKFFVREVKLTTEERNTLDRQWSWRADEEFYRFYLGRDDEGKLVAAVIFLTEFTIHGPVRVAVGLDPNGKIKGATVVELTEESYPWLKPLLDQDFTREYIGRDSRASFALSERLAHASMGSMPHFYAELIASLLQRAAGLFEVAVLKRGAPS
jgi:hypothetical protein